MMNNSAVFPPKDYIAAESALAGISVFKPRPQTEDQRPVVAFDCPQCHAVTAYSATDGGLTCVNCGYYEPPQKEVVGRAADDFEFTLEHLERSAHGWGAAKTDMQCQNCAAITAITTGQMTHTCPFCGSNKVIHQEATQDLLRPKHLIPFKIEESAGHALIRDWLGQHWMVPKSLQQHAAVGQFSGIYLPFWTFDAQNDANWRAQVGHTRTVRTKEGSRTETVWRWESGAVSWYVDDMLIAGTTNVSHKLLRNAQPFNMSELAPYEPIYLAGLQAQAYNIPLDNAWSTARDKMRNGTRQRCRNQASTSKIKNFSMDMAYSQETWRYILLPVYLVPYQYKDKTYQIVINGQTGEIAGQRPADWTKVLLVIFAAYLPALITGFIGLFFFPLLVLSLILLVVAIAATVILAMKAAQLDDA